MTKGDRRWLELILCTSFPIQLSIILHLYLVFYRGLENQTIDYDLVFESNVHDEMSQKNSRHRNILNGLGIS